MVHGNEIITQIEKLVDELIVKSADNKKSIQFVESQNDLFELKELNSSLREEMVRLEATFESLKKQLTKKDIRRVDFKIKEFKKESDEFNQIE
jgi:hypothetical protein